MASTSRMAEDEIDDDQLSRMLDELPSMADTMDGSRPWATVEPEEDELPLGRQTLKLRSQAIVDTAERVQQSPQQQRSPSAIDSAPAARWSPPAQQPFAPQQPAPYASQPQSYSPPSQPPMSLYPPPQQYQPAPYEQGQYQQRQPHQQPFDKKQQAQWNLTPDMMNQPWGARLAQPRPHYGRSHALCSCPSPPIDPRASSPPCCGRDRAASTQQ